MTYAAVVLGARLVVLTTNRKVPLPPNLFRIAM
jgi:hypothetical protein